MAPTQPAHNGDKDDMRCVPSLTHYGSASPRMDTCIDPLATLH